MNKASIARPAFDLISLLPFFSDRDRPSGAREQKGPGGDPLPRALPSEMAAIR
jgi:hypothetical protein